MWGVSYEIDDTETKYIQALQSREKRYRQEIITFYPVGQLILNNASVAENPSNDATTTQAVLDPKKLPSFDAHVFIGPENGPLFLGDAPLCAIGQQIVSAKGPSGTNIDYLMQLVHFMRSELPGESDEHLFEIEKEVLRIMSSISTPN